MKFSNVISGGSDYQCDQLRPWLDAYWLKHFISGGFIYLSCFYIQRETDYKTTFLANFALSTPLKMYLSTKRKVKLVFYFKIMWWKIFCLFFHPEDVGHNCQRTSTAWVFLNCHLFSRQLYSQNLSQKIVNFHYLAACKTNVTIEKTQAVYLIVVVQWPKNFSISFQ
jgi:hypothetical protein